MKPNSLENLLKQDAPPPDPAARLAARRAALAAFERLHPSPSIEKQPKRGMIQALLGAMRPSRESGKHGSDAMPIFSRKAFYGGAASICLAIIGSTVVWNVLRDSPEVGDLQVAADTREAEIVTDQQYADAPVDESSTGPAPADAVGAKTEETQSRDAESRRNAERVEPRKDIDAAAGAAAGDLPVATTDPGKLQDKELTEALKRVPGVAASAVPPEALAKEKDDQMQEVVVAAEKHAAPVPLETPSPVTVVAAESLQAEEIMVTGARATSRGRAAPHKGVPAQTGSGAFRREAKNEAYAPVAPPPPAAPQAEGNDKFQHFDLNSIKQPALDAERVSTFSADVDTSSYSFVRKQLDQGRLPQKDAVRAEEMINYFDYAWPAADSREQPFRPTVVVSDSPWGKGRKLIHIGIKGYELPANKRPDANLVMLIDVSGSMDEPDKLPLVKESMKLLLGSLKPTDTVGIVVYAGAAGMVLPPTQVGDREKITAALERLQAGGSTAGGQGIELAYQLAEKSFRKDALNRILLCTDGDFNVGISGTEELKGLVERKREKGIFLSVLGYGQGNYRDELAQALAQNGNGVAAYIDTLNEARKVLVEQAGSSLFTIAKDVKFQVEFNPATVAEYRLVGYETRALKTEDFNNDKIDAGDIGAGHTVTAMYEITPVGSKARMIDKSRYVKQPEVEGSATEYGFLKMRYKLPDQDKSQLMEQAIRVDTGKASEAIQRDVGFSTAVAGFAQLLRGGQFTGSLGYDDVIRQAQANRGEDPHGYRNEFVQLVRKAQTAR